MYRLSHLISLHYAICHVKQSLIYGEVDYSSFYRVLRKINPRPGLVFYDLGSGTSKVHVRVCACACITTGVLLLLQLSSLPGSRRILVVNDARWLSLLPLQSITYSITPSNKLLIFNWLTSPHRISSLYINTSVHPSIHHLTSSSLFIIVIVVVARRCLRLGWRRTSRAVWA